MLERSRRKEQIPCMESAQYYTKRPDLEEAYLRYVNHRQTDSFVSESFLWMMNYSRRLNNDPDLCQDFLIQFLDKLPRFLDSFTTRPGSRFTGYLARCMRFDFMNYVRKVKKYEPAQCDLPVENFGYHTERTTAWHGPLSFALKQIEPVHRIPMKIQCGWPLDLSELRELSQRHSPEQARGLHESFLSRIQDQEHWKRRHKHKMSLYFDRLHRGNQGRDYRYIRRKLEKERTRNTNTVMSLRDISSYLQVSKAALHRRISVGRRALRTALDRLPEQIPDMPGSLEAGFLGYPEPRLLYQFSTAGDRQFLLLEPIKNLEPVGISLYSQTELCYKLGLSGAFAFPLHLFAPGKYLLKTAGQMLRFKLSI